MAWYDTPTYIGQGLTQGITNRYNQANLAQILNEMQQTKQLQATLGNLPQNLTPEQQMTTIAQAFGRYGQPAQAASMYDTLYKANIVSRIFQQRIQQKEAQDAEKEFYGYSKSGNRSGAAALLNRPDIQQNPYLREKYGEFEKPEVQEQILNAYFSENPKYVAEQTRTKQQQEIEKSSFANLSKEKQNIMVDTSIITGKFPALTGFGQQAGLQRQQFNTAMANRLNDLGLTGADVASIRAENQGLSQALTTNLKVTAANERFASVIEKNAETLKRMESLLKGFNPKDQSRLMNTAMNKLSTVYTGSGDINAIKLLANSIAAETGKLEIGSLGNIGLPVKTHEKFLESFDFNLPLSKMIKVTNTASELAKNRMDSLHDINSNLEGQISSIIDRKSKKTAKSQEFAPTEQETKVLGGKTYIKQNGKWYEQ